MAYTDVELARDIDRVTNIPLIHTLLEVVCQTTGMGFAAVARVTQDRWVACCVRDAIEFGLVAGGELPVETTICREIRDNQQGVIIDDVGQSELFCNHPTPTRYGFQSYISFPIVLKTGEFFGTLCAIDPNPAQLENEKVKGLFTLFTDLIAFHLQQIELLEQTRSQSDQLEQQVQARTRQLQESVNDLQRSNANLEQFAYIASHDLQEPLRKIQSFGDLLQTKRGAELGDDMDLLTRMQRAAQRMSTLVKDLLAYSRITTRQQGASPVLLNQAVEGAVKDLEVLIDQSDAQLAVTALPVVQGDASQLEQLFENLLSNALKFHREGVPPRISISARTVAQTELPSGVKPARQATMYHRIDVSDNGIGFEEKYLDRLFHVFQRLHTKSAYPGTGIGLAICEKVAICHGGAITAVSQPGHGATFQVYLPAFE